jgi:hypothetical protein
MCENAFMRTTIEIPDELFRRAKIRAVHEGVRFKELVARYLEQGLIQSSAIGDESASPRRKRSDLPVARPATGRTIPYLTNAQIEAVLDREDSEQARAGAD